LQTEVLLTESYPSTLPTEHPPALHPHLVQLGLERVQSALELVGVGDGGRDERLPVRVEGWPVKGDLELHDSAGLVFLDQEKEAGFTHELGTGC
jgi:hypothetical protein